MLSSPKLDLRLSLVADEAVLMAIETTAHCRDHRADDQISCISDTLMLACSMSSVGPRSLEMKRREHCRMMWKEASKTIASARVVSLGVGQ